MKPSAEPGRATTAFDYDLEVLVDEYGTVVWPIYRDENGQMTPKLWPCTLTPKR